MTSFWHELRRRKVVRVGTAYAVVAWLLLQVVVSIEEPLGLPDWTDTLVIVLLGIGFVVAIALAWAFDLTSGGLERTRPAREPDAPHGSPVRAGRPRLGYVVTAVAAALAGAGVVLVLAQDSDERWLRDVALPQIEDDLAVGAWQSAYAMTREVEARIPGHPELGELWPRLSWRTSLESEPSGATVYRRPYEGDPETWERLGETPLVDIRFPFGLSTVRLELDGYLPLERTLGGDFVNREVLGPFGSGAGAVGVEPFHLDTDESLPPGKVRISGWDLVLAGEVVHLEDYFLDRYEVTNEAFKRFVDAGGYAQRTFWDPVVFEGDTIPWADAVARFTDSTGRPGPRTWMAGDFPPGTGDHPVSGVSWYEAAAYARFVGEELPTAHHWGRALAKGTLAWQLEQSNFGGSGTRAVQESRAMSYSGAYDLVGNVREWTSTPLGSEFVIRGGSWGDPYYIAGVEDASAPPLDRSDGNGFRLAVTRDAPEVARRLRAFEVTESRMPATIAHEPAPQAVFEAYGRLFDYEQGPLDATVEDVVESRTWIRERITFAPGYSGARMVLYLYLPTRGAAPFQTVVYWPGWDTFRLSSVDGYMAKQVDFLLSSGRAVAFPVYSGSFERGTGGELPAFNTTAYRDNTIEAIKDLRRTIDYLETRRDIDERSLAYFGYSWGGVTAPIALAHEPRLRTGVVYIGGIPLLSDTPEVDPVHALPRVTVPTLVMTGEFDALVPVQNARTYFDLIGTEEKRHRIAPAGHFMPREILIRETLDWLDRYQVSPGG